MSATSDHDLSDLDDAALGAALREARKRAGLTLQELASRTELSIGTLSNIERGGNSPSVRSLRSICRAIGIDGANLFTGEREQTESSGMVVREAARKSLNFKDQHVRKYRITPAVCEDLEAYILDLDQNGGSGEELYSSAGEKIFYVISGKFEIDIEDKTFFLNQGDTLACRPRVLHRWRNGWQSPSTVFLVNNSHFYV